MSFLQPHEDVTGTDRTDTLLSLEASNLTTRDLLRGLSRHLSSATLVGNPAPVVKRMNDRLRNPQPDDLVIEQSTIWRSLTEDSAIKGLGILLEHRTEWYHADQEWTALLAEGEYEVGEKRPTDHVWYIQYGSSAKDVCRWTNCMFTTIPWADERFDIPAGIQDGNAMVFTRDSLLGSLSDSGFKLNLKGMT